MAETRHTGGAKTFSYTNEDLERIRSTDTSSTKDFKDAYAKWQAHRAEEKLLEKEFQKQRNVLLGITIMLALMALLLIWMNYFA
jgi:hypothetical protein